MFIVPISHEHHEARRWPIATFVIIALNVAVFVAMLFLERPTERAAEEASRDVALYQSSHTYLQVKCHGIEVVSEPTEVPREVDPSLLAGEQAKLDEKCDRYDASISKLSRFAYGDIPARGGFTTLITYQFLHAGWIHIGFNLWFLWLCGTNLEDRWGRSVFTMFYLVSGLVAGLAHRGMQPHSWIPLIGASGAIAGAMGGFLVAYAGTRITFFYVYFLSIKPRWGTFGAPAYVMLPLWLASELFDGFVGGSDGTAHWAHVGGFAFGALVALGLKLSGADAMLDAMNERAVSTGQDPRLTSAMELTDAGRSHEAIAILEVLERERPNDIDVGLETLRASTMLGDPARRVSAYLRLVRLYIDGGSTDTAADLWTELRNHRLEGAVSPSERLRIAELFARKSRFDTALICSASAHAAGLIDPDAVRAAVLHATLLVRAGRTVDAKPLLDEAKLSPFKSAELDSKIDAQLALVHRGVSLRP